MTSFLAKEILQKEEDLLKETKAKLIEQLNRLKVEEVALQRYLSKNTEPQQVDYSSTSTAQMFERDTFTDLSYNKDNTNADDPSTLNQVPLENLKPTGHTQPICKSDQEIEEEEEDEST